MMKKIAVCFGLLLGLACSDQDSLAPDAEVLEEEEVLLDLEKAEAPSELGTLQQAIAEAACHTSAPDATLSASLGSPRTDFSPTTYGTSTCVRARKLKVSTTTSQGELKVVPRATVPTSECNGTELRAIVYRNGVLQRDIVRISNPSPGVCLTPSILAAFNFGDGGDWRVIVGERFGLATRAIATTITAF